MLFLAGKAARPTRSFFDCAEDTPLGRGTEVFSTENAENDLGSRFEDARKRLPRSFAAVLWKTPPSP